MLNLHRICFCDFNPICYCKHTKWPATWAAHLWRTVRSENSTFPGLRLAILGDICKDWIVFFFIASPPRHLWSIKGPGNRALTRCLFWGASLPSPEKAVAPRSSTLAWKIPGMEEPGGLQSMGSRRVGHDWSDLAACLLSQLAPWLKSLPWLNTSSLNEFTDPSCSDKSELGLSKGFS